VTREARFGPRALPNGGYQFRLWAPAAKSVEVLTPHLTTLERTHDGWFVGTDAQARTGTRYKFRIDDDFEVPDPASAYQPDDVFGASEIVAHSYEWKSTAWRGRPWHEAVMLELHVGTFTPTGTFGSAIARLDDVVQTGFTAIELMPVADFFGRWNWGYDGVLWFAPDSAYGRPEDLKALVDAAHARGLMMFLDVVYNHFGPEGNFLPRYAPGFFAADGHTPWGAAINYDVPQVRDFAIENALHWLDHYRFDGLRLDAVHAIVRQGEPSILEDISKSAGRLAAEQGRAIHLLLENDGNEASRLDPVTNPPDGKYRAQWNDDFHHAWHVLLTGETSGYYRDYARSPMQDTVRIMRSGFAYQGEPSIHRNGSLRGEPSGNLPPTAFVSFLQNHDQIGNRAFGERLDALASPVPLEAALAIMLIAPMPPMMFMGEEWGETRPFPFFCDFRGALADAVREGRRKEFHDAYAAHGAEVPDPLSERTFADAHIDWDEVNQPAQAMRRDLVRRLLSCRAQFVTPHLADTACHAVNAVAEGDILRASWRLGPGTLYLVANLGDGEAHAAKAPGHAIWLEAPNDAIPGDVLPPWSVFWTWEA
jgi:malto-oligosyltrehalose trehalohydrolase